MRWRGEIRRSTRQSIVRGFKLPLEMEGDIHGPFCTRSLSVSQSLVLLTLVVGSEMQPLVVTSPLSPLSSHTSHINQLVFLFKQGHFRKLLMKAFGKCNRTLI
jgi:hypothetical protein